MPPHISTVWSTETTQPKTTLEVKSTKLTHMSKTTTYTTTAKTIQHTYFTKVDPVVFKETKEDQSTISTESFAGKI